MVALGREKVLWVCILGCICDDSRFEIISTRLMGKLFWKILAEFSLIFSWFWVMDYGSWGAEYSQASTAEYHLQKEASRLQPSIISKRRPQGFIRKESCTPRAGCDKYFVIFFITVHSSCTCASRSGPPIRPSYPSPKSPLAGELLRDEILRCDDEGTWELNILYSGFVTVQLAHHESPTCSSCSSWFELSLEMMKFLLHVGLEQFFELWALWWEERHYIRRMV